MKIFTQILLVGLSVLLIANAYAYENEKVIDLASVPANIREVAMQKVSGIELVSATLIGSKRGVIYELKGKLNDRGYEIKINERGKIVEYQMDDSIPMLLSEIPDDIKQAVKTELKNPVIIEGEGKNIGKVLYKMEVLSEGDRYDVTVDNYGKVTRVEQENDEDWDKEGNGGGREEDDD